MQLRGRKRKDNMGRRDRWAGGNYREDDIRRGNSSDDFDTKKATPPPRSFEFLFNIRSSS